jgi:chaperone required for assembly of F1-ATPase
MELDALYSTTAELLALSSPVNLARIDKVVSVTFTVITPVVVALVAAKAEEAKSVNITSRSFFTYLHP